MSSSVVVLQTLNYHTTDPLNYSSLLMEHILLQSFVFIASIFILVRSSDFFILNAEKVGLALRWPHFLTGVLIVAIGTSLPELATGVASVLQGETDMLLGNVLGSNVANIFLGLGLVFFLANKSVPFKHNIFDVHFPVLIMATALAVFAAVDSKITSVESFFFFGVLGAYLWYLFSDNHKASHNPLEKHPKFEWKYVAGCVLGLVGLIVSSKFAIDAVIFMAEASGLAKTALAATLVAVGTSLPEMMVVFSALKRKNVELVIGNIIGSNIFNILLIVGVGSAITTLEVSALTLQIILPFAVGATLIYWVISIDKKITKQEGLAMTFLYVLFIGKLFGAF